MKSVAVMENEREAARRPGRKLGVVHGEDGGFVGLMVQGVCSSVDMV